MYILRIKLFAYRIYKYLLIIFAVTTFIIVYRSPQEYCIPITRRFINDTSCYWPPENISEIQNEEGYNLTLCIKLNEDAKTNSVPKRYLMRDLFYVTLSRRTVSFEELTKLPRKVFKTMKYPNIFHTYPQDVPVLEIAENITEGRAVSYEPKYNFPIKLLNISKSICYPGTKHDLVIVVKTPIYSVEARNEFREHIKKQTSKVPNFKVGVVFSIGIPRSDGGRVFDRDGIEFILEGPAGDVLEKYGGKADKLMQKIQEEISQFDDIILADYVDTYFNLSLKTVTNLRWISAFCNKFHGDFFMIIDDDHRINLPMLEKLSRTITTSKLRNSIHGRIAWLDTVYRNTNQKYFMTYNEIPWRFVSPYPRGMSQLIGADIVDSMAIATAYTKHNYLNEDVFIGILAQKLGIPLYSISGFNDHTDYNEDIPPIVAHKKFLN